MKERQRWQPEEDALLRAYVKQYGPKEWHLVSQRMGKPLDRDAKSCLERWKNYLKPGIKKGSLTPEEQNLVISLQAKYGNKWKKIASEVPGRTAKRLGKWWEVFKEKQLKLQQQKQQKTQQQQRLLPSDHPDPSAPSPTPPPTTTPERSLHGQYDHILETFAEKYVQPKLLKLHQQQPQPSLLPSSLLMPSHLPLPEAPPILSLATTTSSTTAVLPAWMNNPNMVSSTSSLSSSSSATPSPSVSLSLSPSEPTGLDSVSQEMGLTHQRFFTVHQMGTLVQYCKELEEGRQSWLQHKKEATWRLTRLEQQLESEKARKRREKMEEVEAKIRSLREEEMAYLDKIENECREQLNAIQRDADAKEAKMVELWSSKHVKLAKLVEQMGIHSFPLTKDLH
ncbi:PREDICTED: protein rough sheath 2 homolog [Nelumbo nucifera]|uniref:Protein rough sheath 2 homolog n=1 Tax=Nelumbo nucifera TaxID=4432 RepID=A0A1U8AQM1_NELNU|nr:PREDICTED: protein rough sheath 2 homolog [Nelumbo nucifera]